MPDSLNYFGCGIPYCFGRSVVLNKVENNRIAVGTRTRDVYKPNLNEKKNSDLNTCQSFMHSGLDHDDAENKNVLKHLNSWC